MLDDIRRPTIIRSEDYESQPNVGEAPTVETVGRPIQAFPPTPIAAGGIATLSVTKPPGAKTLLLSVNLDNPSNLANQYCYIRAWGITPDGILFALAAYTHLTYAGPLAPQVVAPIGGKGDSNFARGTSISSSDTAIYNAIITVADGNRYDGMLPSQMRIEISTPTLTAVARGVWLYGE